MYPGPYQNYAPDGGGRWVGEAFVYESDDRQRGAIQ